MKPSDVPPGETSLTDVQLLLAVQQLVDTKHGTQQLVLHQVRLSDGRKSREEGGGGGRVARANAKEWVGGGSARC